MSLEVQDKITIAKEKKEIGDQAFKSGELTDGTCLSLHAHCGNN